MTDTETVNEVEEEIVEQPIDGIVEQAQEENPQAQEVENIEEQEVDKNIPLSALKKERRKRQEAEQELKIYRDQQLKAMQAEEPEVDDSQYEPVTKGDLSKREGQILRAVEERSWIKNNPERTEYINEKLANFLKIRPNLAGAIEAAPNRYEEAWELMNALSPKQKKTLNKPVAMKKEAPNSPSGVSKSAALNQAVDVMSMSDKEYLDWRKAQKNRR